MSVPQNKSIIEDQYTILQRSLLDNNSYSVETNHSIFDERNSLFMTEQSWALANNLVDKKNLKLLIDVLHDHITVVKDYVFAYETTQDR